MEDKTNLYRQNFELKKENAELKKEVKRLSYALSKANGRIKYLEKKLENIEEKHQKEIDAIISKTIEQVTARLEKEHQKEIAVLNKKIAKLESRLNADSTNSSLPTSKNPIGKNKIQNNREKSDKPVGAPKGHAIAKLDYFKDDEIDETIEHTLDKCPECGGKLKATNTVISDIIDFEIKIKRTRNNIHNYKCCNCKKNITANKSLPRGASYGPHVNATILSMINNTNVPFNKVVSHISGITNGEINISEGYAMKLQRKSSKTLTDFNKQLKEKIISLKRLHWDDTTISYGLGEPHEGFTDKEKEYITKNPDKKIKEGYIRFYGDDEWALFISHSSKDADTVKEDGILTMLGEECVVMHDHLLLNYNKDLFSFENAECNAHTLRYLKGVKEEFEEHEWPDKMRELLVKTNNEKKSLIANAPDNTPIEDIYFSKEKLNEIYSKYDEIIKLGYKEYESLGLTSKDTDKERKLLARLDKYKENHLLFAKDFSVGFTNNTSERGLRQVKRKLAVSFMFKNMNRAKDYATVKSYLETTSRHDISGYEACLRLFQGKPYTVEEMEKN